MKKIVLFVCILTVSNSFGQVSNLSIMTYNIRLDVASDGENAWPLRKDYLIDQIKFYEPSVFGIQEGLPHQVSYMNKSLVEYDFIGEGRDGENNGEYSAIFYDKSRFDIVESDTFWLSLTPDKSSKNWDAALPRICTYALFKEKETGIQFWVFNTHFDHKGVQSRLKSIAIILDKIVSENSENDPVIFMGDLNVEPKSDVISKLNDHMIDSYDASMETPFGPYGTFNGFNFHELITRRIDYIYISKSTEIKALKYAVLSDSKDLKYPSDHLPVFIEVTINNK